MLQQRPPPRSVTPTGDELTQLEGERQSKVCSNKTNILTDFFGGIINPKLLERTDFFATKESEQLLIARIEEYGCKLQLARNEEHFKCYKNPEKLSKAASIANVKDSKFLQRKFNIPPVVAAY